MVEIEKFKKEYEKVLNQLRDPELFSNWEKSQKLSEKKEILEKILEKEKEIQKLKTQIEENKTLLATEKDPELISLANTEIAFLKEKEKKLENELNVLLGEYKSISQQRAKTIGQDAIILEIRAGTGGEEAALFARDLFRMYTKYAKSQNWQTKILDLRESELGGFKEVIFQIKGKEVFSKMKNEAGVHRVQRVPKTEKSGRIHTSTATVAVLPKPKKTEIKIRPEDLKIEFYRASGPGGQYVNKRETAVRITHLPTGLVVTSQTERSQAQNKENAMAILQARILKRKMREQEEKILAKRRSQIKRAERAEKIRTYNFLQDRVTDHRIKKSWHNLEEILEGKLDPVIGALQKLEN